MKMGIVHMRCRCGYALVLGVFLCGFFPVHGVELSGRRMFWAHQVPWMRPDNASFMVQKYYNFPLHDPPTGSYRQDVRNEIQAAMRQGFTGFSVDVIQEKSGVTFESAYVDLLDAARGLDFCVALCLDGKPDVETTARQLHRLIERFKQHPNFPCVDGKPVVFTYVYVSRSVEQWHEIRERLKALGSECYLVANMDSGYAVCPQEKIEAYAQTFDAFYAFSLNGLDRVDLRDKITLFQDVARALGKPYVASLSPGYYGAWLNGRNDYYQPHYGFDQLHRLFMLVDAKQQQWMHATTWNDYDETSLCPMIFTPANAEIVAAYADRFMGRPCAQAKPRVYAAYPREILAGTVCRIEILSTPVAQKGTVRVFGALRNEQGDAVYTLAEKELACATFDRQEWLIPTGDLACNAVLIPELTRVWAEGRETVRFPAILPVNSHLQNAVTVKVGHHQMCTVQNTVTVREEGQSIVANVVFSTPAKPAQRISLWRNDRPIACFPAERKKAFFNLDMSGTGDFSMIVQNGTMDCALRSFTTNHAPEFVWTATNLVARRLAGWMCTAARLCVMSNTVLRVSAGATQRDVTLDELRTRGYVYVGSVRLDARKTEAAYFEAKPLNVHEGRLEVSVYGERMRPGDIYWALFECADQTFCWSAPVLSSHGVITQNVIQTAITLETPSASSGSGDTHHRPFLTSEADTPFHELTVTARGVHRATVRESFWPLDGSGIDCLGDQTVVIPETWFVTQAGENRKVLTLDGSRKQKMRLRTWPSGSTTVDFWVQPDASRRAVRQTLVYRSGCMDGISVYLEPEGFLSVVRDGDSGVKRERLASRTAIAYGAWSHVRIINDQVSLTLTINGVEQGHCALVPARSYGNCTWFIGGGASDAQNYVGALKDLRVWGIALPENTPCEE